MAQLSATFTNQKDACDGLNNASIDVTVTNATGTITVNFFGPPNFILNPTDGVPETVNGLHPQTYLVIVQDDVETVGYSVTINNVSPDLAASINTTSNNTNCTTPNGAISLNVSGGTGSYSFSWTGPAGSYPDAAALSNLPGGTYNVEVFDAGTNCSRVLGPIVLTDPAVIVQTITTPSPLELCPGDDAVISLGASEINKTYEILVNGTPSGFTSPGDAGGLAINITLPSGNFADGDILTVEGYEGICPRFTMSGSVDVSIFTESVAPTGAAADNPNYCDDAIPANITLSYTGGTLGTGATAEWYDDAAFTSSIGSGNNLLIPAPLATTTYFVRFEGSCNFTTGQSVTITVDNASLAPTAANVDFANYCNDAAPANITLSYTGGALGTGATAEWYDDAGFTNNVGSGNNLVLGAPLTSTSYFVRFEGVCGNSTGQSVTVTVDLASIAPTGAAVDNPNYCDDAAPANITLNYSGGSLGTGATAQWYDDAGFTSSVGSGNNLTLVAPLTTTTYYVRFEGVCNTTTGQNVTVTVDNASVAPTNANVDISNYCNDAAPANIILSYSGGSLGTGATAEWYEDAGFTSAVGSGNNLSIAAPLVSTTYFVRFEGTCGNTSGQSVAVTVDLASTPASSAGVDITAYCDDAIPANITLSYTGGTLGTGATAQWYDDPGLTSSVGSGNNLTLPSPNVTTTYYVRFEGICNNTTEQNVTVTVNNASIAPTGATVDSPAYCDDAPPANITLSYTGGNLGTGATAEWYSDAGFTSSVGSGNNLSIAAPLVSTSYFVRFEGTCGNTTGQSVNVTVSSASTDPTGASVDTPTFCDDAAPATITLTYSGGNLGTGATAEWYDDAALTSSVGAGNNLTIPAPALTTIYYVRFEGACNLTAAQSVTVTVEVASVAPTAANVDTPAYCDDAIPANITLSFTGGSLGTGATAEWYDDPAFTNSVGSGNNLLLPAPTASTTYFVRFEGSCGNTAGQSVLVDVVTPPDPTITGNNTACANTTESYSVPAGAANYVWTLSGGDGVISSGQNTASITVDWGLTGGDLEVQVFGPAPANCTATQSLTIFVYSTIMDLNPQTVDLCQDGDLPVLVATPSPGATVNWYDGPSASGTLLHTGDTFTPSAADLDMTTPGTTVFTYTQTACLTSNDAEVTINVLPLPNAGEDGSTNACLVDAPLDLFSFLNGSPVAGGTWTDDDGSGALSGSAFDPAVAGLGDYNFTYQVDGTGPCAGNSATAIVTVSVISTSTTPVPDQVSYTGCTYATAPTMTTPGLNIRWYDDAALTNQVGTGNSFTPKGKVNGIGEIDTMAVGVTTFYVTQDDGCGESAAAMVEIVLDGGSAEVNPDALVNTYPEQDVGAFEVFNIQSDFPPFDIRLEDASGNVIYDWTEVAEDRLGDYSYLFTLLPVGDYIAWVMDQNGCMFPVEQSIGLETDVFIPNVFTPNGDNYNDVFKVLNVSGPIQIQINNRWGVKVFESSDYQNDWEAENLPEGVYFYTIKMSGVVYKGNVEVWRNDGPLGN